LKLPRLLLAWIHHHINLPVPEILHLQVGVDESEKSRQTSVDTRLTGLSTSITPRNGTNQSLASIDNGATAVTLARVLASGSQTSAEHGVGDLRRAVVGTAISAGDDRNGDLAESSGEG
jgi:hypothetical protein